MLAILIMVSAVQLYAGASCGAVNVSGAISSDTVWGLTAPDPGGVYTITGSITVTNGATLTIEAGVQVLFNSGQYLYVGGSNAWETGRLVADGTAGQPVLFAANGTTNPGTHCGIQFRATASSGSLLDNCIIRHAGYGSTAGITCDSASPTVSDCTVQNNSSYGIRCLGTAQPTISGCLLNQNGAWAIYCEGASAPAISGGTISAGPGGIYAISPSLPVITGVAFDGTTNYPIQVYPDAAGNLTNNTFVNIPLSYAAINVISGTVSRDALWHAHSLPFRLLSGVTVRGKDGTDNVTTLEIEAGTVFRMGSGAAISVASDTDPDLPGALRAIGTPGSPILFTADTSTPAAGYWGGIWFYRYAQSSLCELAECVVEYGTTAIYCNFSSPSVTNVVCRFFTYYGLSCASGAAPTVTGCYIHGCLNAIYIATASSPTITNCSIRTSTGSGIVVASGACAPVFRGCTISDHLSYGMDIRSEDCRPQVRDCAFNNNGSYPVAGYARHFGQFSGNSYTGNSIQQLYVQGNTIPWDGVWENPGIPYKVISYINLSGTDGEDGITTLTIAEGATVRMGASTYFWVGSTDPDNPGVLRVMGTPANPVTFTADSASPTRGYWRSLRFQQYGSGELNGCIVEYAGSNEAYALGCTGSSPRIANTEVRQSSGHGIYLTGATAAELSNVNAHDNTTNGICLDNGAAQALNSTVRANGGASYAGIYIAAGTPAVSGCVIQQHSYRGILVAQAAAPVITGNMFISNSNPLVLYAADLNSVSGNQFTGNTPQKIWTIGERIYGDVVWRDQGVPYIIKTTDVSIKGTGGVPASLTVEAGVTVEWDRYLFLYVGDTNMSWPGILKVNGTADKPVLFTYNRDYAPPLTTGEWYGVGFWPSAVGAESLVRYLTVERAGYYSYGGFYILGTSPTLDHCAARLCYSQNVWIGGGADPVLDACRIENGGTYGIVCTGLGTAPRITNSVITGQATGIYISSWAEPVIGGSPGQGNNIAGNTTWGVNNAAAVVCINAPDWPPPEMVICTPNM